MVGGRWLELFVFVVFDLGGDGAEGFLRPL
jgi:hypothetical protein